MLTRRRIMVSAVLALMMGASGCSVKTEPPAGARSDGGAADSGGGAKPRPQSKLKTASLKAKAGKTPPAGARSTGARTKPMTGAIAVPITDTEVFTFEEAFDEGGAPTTVSWAYVAESGANYLWASGTVACPDGSPDPTAGFLMEVKADGTGTWLFSLPGCASGDLFGCDFDAAGTETTCGACTVKGELLVCVVNG